MCINNIMIIIIIGLLLLIFTNMSFFLQFFFPGLVFSPVSFTFVILLSFSTIEDLAFVTAHPVKVLLSSWLLS